MFWTRPRIRTMFRHAGQDRVEWSLHAALQGAAAFRSTSCIDAESDRRPRNAYHASACLQSVVSGCLFVLTCALSRRVWPRVEVFNSARSRSMMIGSTR
jgi:hypothetical protein